MTMPRRNGLEHEREPAAPAPKPARRPLAALLLSPLLALPLTVTSGFFTGLPAGFRRVSPHNTATTRLTGKNAATSVTSVILP